jgi:hypothetical protein
MTDKKPDVTESNEDGQRTVSYELELEDGTVVLQHSFPDALSHHYSPAGMNEDVPLFKGDFTVNEDPELYNGDIRWRWGATPRIEYRGTRSTRHADIVKLLKADKPGDLWVSRPRIGVDLVDGQLPAQPSGLLPIENVGHYVTDRIEEHLGEGKDLEEVTFLIPNGWQASDAAGICDPNEQGSIWRGRTVATGSGWEITMDLCPAMANLNAWRELKDGYGQQFTHVGILRRADGSTFDGQSAFELLDRIRLGLCLALGQRVTCALPVGYRAGSPVWTRWRSAPVQAYRRVSHLLDETIASAQVGSIVGLMLDGTGDAGALGALTAAIAYYTSANNDVTVDLTVPLPVSGLQLMTYYRFVSSSNATHSRTQWKSQMTSTEKEIRHLLEDCKIDLTIPSHLKSLIDARTRLPADKQTGDALTTIMAMRNVVTHPTRDLPFDKFDIYMWAEAGMLARYWLCLAILREIGYQGRVANVLSDQPRWTGSVKDVPWL